MSSAINGYAAYLSSSSYAASISFSVRRKMPYFDCELNWCWLWCCLFLFFFTIFSFFCSIVIAIFSYFLYFLCPSAFFCAMLLCFLVPFCIFINWSCLLSLSFTFYWDCQQQMCLISHARMLITISEYMWYGIIYVYIWSNRFRDKKVYDFLS